jgi:hypothetical protein
LVDQDEQAFETPPQGKQSRMKVTAQQVIGNDGKVWTVELIATETMPVSTN